MSSALGRPLGLRTSPLVAGLRLSAGWWGLFSSMQRYLPADVVCAVRGRLLANFRGDFCDGHVPMVSDRDGGSGGCDCDSVAAFGRSAVPRREWRRSPPPSTPTNLRETATSQAARAILPTI